MASGVTTEKISANINDDLVYDFDPDADTAVAVGWVDMRDYGTFKARFIRTVGTSNVDTFKIQASADSAGGSPVDVVVKTISDEPNAFGANPDNIFVECTAEQVREVLAAARYVSLIVEFATSTDEAIVTYLFANPKHSQSGMTADVVA